MPHTIRIISQFSPLHWGLNGFYDIFLRGGDLMVVLAETGKLLFFFVLMLMVAIVYNNYNRAK